MVNPRISKGSIWWCNSRNRYAAVEHSSGVRVKGTWVDGGTFDYDRATFLKDFDPAHK
jgi:hypothetical protein